MLLTSIERGLTFRCEIEDEIARVRARRGAFAFGIDLEEKQRFFALLDELQRVEEVKAILLLNDVDALSSNEHRDYLDLLRRTHGTERSERAAVLLVREDNALDQFAALLMGYEKLIVSCLAGEIAAPFFGLSLMSDVRLAQKGMTFRLSHVDFGVPPVGGLGFLLPRFVGKGRAQDWLLSGGTIDTGTARDYGLVNAILDSETFEADCVDWTRNFIHKGTAHIRLTRRLINHDIQTFSAFMHEESKIRRQAWNQRSGD